MGLAAVLCRRRFGNPVIATLTADHLIEPVAQFQKTLLSAARRAVTIGRKNFKRDSPDYARYLNNYAQIYFAMKNLVLWARILYYRLVAYSIDG